MRADIFFSNAFRQVMRHPLDQTASVHKDQGRAVLLRKLHNAVVNFIPHLIAGHWAEQCGRNFNREIELALVPDVYDFWVGATVASKKMRNLFDWLLRG